MEPMQPQSAMTGRTLITGRGKVQIEASLASSATKSNTII